MRLIKGKTYYTKDWYPSYKGMMDRCYNKNGGWDVNKIFREVNNGSFN